MKKGLRISIGLLVLILMFSITGVDCFAQSKTVKQKLIKLTKEEIAINSINSKLLLKINELRESQKLEELEIDSSLVEISKVRAIEATSFWSHTRPNGEDSLKMLPKDKWAGENLSYVVLDCFNYSNEEIDNIVDIMFKELCDSPTHYDNMVFNEFKTIGISTNYYKQKDGRIKLCSAYIFSN